jgi:hypothetical protein
LTIQFIIVIFSINQLDNGHKVFNSSLTTAHLTETKYEDS